MTRLSRRQYVGAAAATGLAALAGCSDLLDDIDSQNEEPVGEESNASENGGGSEDEIDYENVEGSISFVRPSDGDEVTSPVSIELEVENFDVTPAGDEPQQGAGHLHVIVDEGCVEPGELIEFDEGYEHISDGELETQLQMDPGEYDLCAQAGDATHHAYALTDEISIEVTEDTSQEGAEGNPPDERNQSESGDADDENPINVNETENETENESDGENASESGGE
ncbi:DUF4399 domain-containing protein [Halosolutus gelatinilyticus]|uniref:DUF4399 domain-containing protein n=1 Tax=Halosolutus gelatinilyticus TaxID=2931975 RepID=UPI001FF27A82|nr:DUF4399 domain-containing protein [Halosolutus gelatinilyticus]